MLYEKQDTAGSELLPQAKDPETTAQWIERCLAGSEAIPESLKIQMACCLVATGEAATISDGLARVIRHSNSFLSRMSHVIRLLPHRNMKFLHLY